MIRRKYTNMKKCKEVYYGYLNNKPKTEDEVYNFPLISLDSWLSEMEPVRGGVSDEFWKKYCNDEKKLSKELRNYHTLIHRINWDYYGSFIKQTMNYLGVEDRACAADSLFSLGEFKLGDLTEDELMEILGDDEVLECCNYRQDVNKLPESLTVYQAIKKDEHVGLAWNTSWYDSLRYVKDNKTSFNDIIILQMDISREDVLLCDSLEYKEKYGGIEVLLKKQVVDRDDLYKCKELKERLID